VEETTLGMRLWVLTIAVEKLQLVVSAVVGLFSRLLLGTKQQRHTQAWGMQLSTLGYR